MRTLSVFNHVSLDGYFVDAHGDMSWAHKQDDEWNAFTAGNAKGGGALLFGRVTYDMMARYWPSPMALRNSPAVAERMNSLPKVVFSRSMTSAAWANTRVVGDDPAEEVRKMKSQPGPDMVIMGSGTIVAQLTQARLIDQYQLVLSPIVLGSGRTLFEGMHERVHLRLVKTRAFSNGNVVLWYTREVDSPSA
jgi:dihydrofolate reductase